jgi:hypothetical protein
MQRQNLLLTALIATIVIGLPALTDSNLRPVNAELLSSTGFWQKFQQCNK